MRPAFVLAAASRPCAHLLQARRQGVTRRLELAEPGQARAGRGAGGSTERAGGREEREAVGDQPGELVLELRDLPAQRRAGGPLGVDRSRRGRRHERRGRRVERPHMTLVRVLGAIGYGLAMLDQACTSSGGASARQMLPAPVRCLRRLPASQAASSALALDHSASSA